jgi:dTDP-4-amino-4,6-dideoxygalactose transaminase
MINNSLRVPFFSYGDFFTRKTQLFTAAFEKTLNSGQFVGGGQLIDFESQFGDYLGEVGVIGVANGLDAIRISLKSLGVKAGDQVLVPSHTFIATWLAVTALGATPIPVPVNKKGRMEISDINSRITELTKAVIVVHMHGLPTDVPAIRNAIPERVFIIEDVAQAHGAQVGGQMTGTLGDMAAFSFYPTKNLGALGDAGAITSKNPDLLDLAKSFANYGSDPKNKYSHLEPGENSRLDPIQAGFLNIMLDCLNEFNLRRQRIAELYLDSLVDQEDLLQPMFTANEGCVWHHFPIFSQHRSLIQKKLADAGIGTEIHYPVQPGQSVAMKKMGFEYFDNGAQLIADRILSLPMNPFLTDAQVDYVCENISTLRLD